jgi:hypothetical protein
MMLHKHMAATARRQVQSEGCSNSVGKPVYRQQSVCRQLSPFPRKMLLKTWRSFGRRLVTISAGTPVILIEGFVVCFSPSRHSGFNLY